MCGRKQEDVAQMSLGSKYYNHIWSHILYLLQILKRKQVIVGKQISYTIHHIFGNMDVDSQYLEVCLLILCLSCKY